MLQSLRLTNFAVIEEAEVGFGPGLTVVTGETGAGKSIVIDALSVVLGGRVTADVVRTGADEAAIEAVFTCDGSLREKLEQMGLPDLGDELLVRRVVVRVGRSRAWVNGALVTAGVLSELMRGQVEVAGQHEHMALLEPASHLGLIDELADEPAALEGYQVAWSALGGVEQQLAAVGGDEAQAAQRADFVRFQLEELERVAPLAGEDVALDAERVRLASVERLRHAAHAVEHDLSSREDSALDLLGRSLAALGEVEKADPALAGLRAGLLSAQVELQEAARALGRYQGTLEADPQRLKEVEDRLEQLRRLCRKHAAPLDAVVARRVDLERELAELTTRGERRAQLELARQQARQAVADAARPLTAARRRAGQRLQQRVVDRLARLAMARARFEVSLVPIEPGPRGADGVELAFSANPGEALKSLHKVASGGEASRLMLAIRAALEKAELGRSIVFDEADAGVGGAVADAVGRLIKEVSRGRQVLCVTHLPQVAAHADTHLRIEKLQAKNSTRSIVQALAPGDDRERELARMLSGLVVSHEALGAARSLLDAARRPAARVKPRTNSRAVA